MPSLHFGYYVSRGCCCNSTVPYFTQLHTTFMGKSRVRILSPPRTVQLVEWKVKKNTQGRKGKWCPVKQYQPSQSAQSSPTKSPTKQSSSTTLPQCTPDFDSYNADWRDHGPIGSLNVLLAKKKTKVWYFAFFTSSRLTGISEPKQLSPGMDGSEGRLPSSPSRTGGSAFEQVLFVMQCRFSGVPVPRLPWWSHVLHQMLSRWA